MKHISCDYCSMIHLFNSQWFGLENKIPEDFTREQMRNLLKLETPLFTRSSVYRRAPYVLACIAKGMSFTEIGENLKITPERVGQLCKSAKEIYITKWEVECMRTKYPEFVYDINLNRRIYGFLVAGLHINYKTPIDELYKYSFEEISKVTGIGPYYMEIIEKSLEKIGLPRI